MTLAEIDHLLRDWKQTIDVIAANLVDLHNLPTYQKLARTQLSGVTLSRAGPALASLNETFQNFQLLVETVKSASAIREQMPAKGSDQKSQSIVRLLTGPSIALPAPVTPAVNRGLLTAAAEPHWISPSDLVHSMTEAYDRAKSVVLAVDQCWERLEWDVAALEAATGETFKPIRDSISSDPLGALEAYERAKKDSLGAADRRNRIVHSLAEARDLLKHTIDTRNDAETAYRESLQKIADTSSLQVPVALKEVEALTQWLETLESRFADGLLDPIAVGLERWNARAHQCSVLLNRAVSANRSPLDTRRELRGRLKALRAKALALGRAESPDLVALAQNAETLLYAHPTSLAEAARAVAQFQSALEKNQQAIPLR